MDQDKTTTPKKYPEVWPFHDMESGVKILADRYYGFGDGGGIAGDAAGYKTRQEALVAITEGDYDDTDFSINKEDLGGVSIVIISGREFVDQLNSIEPENDTFIFGIGYWNNMTEEQAEAIQNEYINSL